ncbi:UDP-N-acetylglucosamine 2-epimerase (non-hydrolyzing) [Paludibacter sp.]
MIKVLTIIGARPQIIKAAAISRAINNYYSDRVEEVILHTGQHYDTEMSDVFFNELNIPMPKYNLNIGSGNHGEQTAKMISGIEEVLLSEHYDAIILYGDTNSTLAGAVAASKLHIPIVHIEAGLRSFNMAMPEEINRIVCDQLSTLLFAPTDTAISNLRHEGFFDSKTTFADGNKRNVYNSGDIMYDNSVFFGKVAGQKTDIIQRVGLCDNKFVLATIHRDNNTDNPERLEAIVNALHAIANQYDIEIILPVHPRTKNILKKPEYQGISEKLKDKIRLIPPASFFEIIELEKHAQIILTDSGGVQKEAYFFKKPCVILRSETEWLEIVEQQAGIVTDADTQRIINAYQTLITRCIDYAPVFGNGKAAEFIVEKIIESLS